VLQLDKRRHEAIVAEIWQWLVQQWSLQPMADRLENTLNRVDPLHLIATLVMALPPASTPGVPADNDAGIETHPSKPKQKRRVADAPLDASVVNKRLKLVDSRHDSVMLTLQPSAASWPQQSLRSSDVRLLPVVPLDQLQSTMAKQGVAHIADALSTELVSAIVTKMVPWLDKLCAELIMTSRSKQSAGAAKICTGATVEFLADGTARECESNTELAPRSLPSIALLQQLLADPRLQATARHVFGLDAHTEIYPSVYLRIRHPQHYTRLHSDYSFFVEHQLLDPHGAHAVGEEPVCTVWIPLFPCGPESGALLLLPETRTLAQPSEMQANKSVPKSFQRKKKIGQSDGYSVSSARMQAGSALLFGPTVVHGGARRAADPRARAAAGPRYSIDIRLVRRLSTTAPPPSTPPAGPLVGIELNPGPVVCSPAASAIAVDYSPAPRLPRGILKRSRPDDEQPDDESRTRRRRGVTFAELLTQVRVFERQPPDVPVPTPPPTPLPPPPPAAQYPLESFDSVRLWLIKNPLRPPPEFKDDVGDVCSKKKKISARARSKSKGNSSSPPLFHRSNTWCLYGDEHESDLAATPARSGAHVSDSAAITANVALVELPAIPADSDPLVVEEDGFFLRLEW
jgi:ectoine hydroxylase-related dioxygenase (phytanoyl-CoA dioxygenase family)